MVLTGDIQVSRRHCDLSLSGVVFALVAKRTRACQILPRICIVAIPFLGSEILSRELGKLTWEFFTLIHSLLADIFGEIYLYFALSVSCKLADYFTVLSNSRLN